MMRRDKRLRGCGECANLLETVGLFLDRLVTPTRLALLTLAGSRSQPQTLPQPDPSRKWQPH
jgi:hypothetical protein